MRLETESPGELALPADDLAGSEQSDLGQGVGGSGSRIHAPKLTSIPLEMQTVIPLTESSTLDSMPSAANSLPESPFWKRLKDAFRAERLPTSQNGIAKEMGMSQGTVQAWVRGESLPTMDNAVRLAAKAGVCVQWLLTGEAPRRPGPRDPLLAEVIEIWEVMRPDRQEKILEYARLLHNASKGAAEHEAAQPRPTSTSAPTRLSDRRARK